MADMNQERRQDPLDKLLTMGWQDLLLPVFTSGSLMLICFYIGHYQFSLLWVLLLTALYLLKTRLWVARQEARLQMRKQILRERGALGIAGMTNKELPNWIRFPDSERVEWVNQMLLQLWPYISEYSANFMREFIEPQVLAQMPSPFKSFKFIDIDMGDMPCRVSGLKVYTQNVGRDKIIIDLDVAYAGDAEFKVKVCGFTGGMNELVLSGRVRCILQPLIPQPPMVAGISGSFVELPKFDFNLTGMGEFIQLPLLNDAIRSVVNAQLANLCVLPNTMIIPLVPDINITKLFVPLPDFVLRIKVVEAKNLENKDVSFIVKDKSDPYCELQLGSQLFKTKTINNNLDPKFNEYFEAVVDQASAQKLRINVFDQDTTGSDEELGHLSIPMTFVEKGKVVSKWFNLESAKHGALYLKLFWCTLSSSSMSVSRPLAFEQEWRSANRPVHSMLMVVFVDNVKDLPFPKSNTEASPVLELTLANATQRTPVKVRTNNPVYQSKFLFLIKESSDKDLQELSIKAVDSNTTKSLGELSIPLTSIMEQAEMEVFDKIYHLQHGVHTATITLTIRIRYIIPPNEEHDLSSYANASHVERASESTDSNTLNRQPSNGDAFAPEPGKRPETDSKNHPESQAQLNTSRFTSINRRNSNVSTASSKQTSKSLKNKFLRFRKTKSKRSSVATDLGTVEYALRFNEHASSLVFDVISAHNLVPHSADGKISPYVSVRLYLDSPTGQMLKVKRHTNIIDNTLSPIFDNRFEFDVKQDELTNYRFVLIVKDHQHRLLSKPTNLGQTEISLANFSKSDTIRQRVNLELP